MTNLPGWDKATSPFHSGERELQSRLGLADRQDMVGRRIIRPYMPDQHREFFAQLPFFVVGSVDADGAPWASVLFGKPGFISTPTDRELTIDAAPLPGDPLSQNLTSGAPLGFVGIELPTRRRNRVNGVLTQADNAGLRIDVVQSFGNCPQYIQTRDMTFVRDPKDEPDTKAETFTTLDTTLAEMIRNADTFFVASYNPKDDVRDTGGVDVNHRGGRPGFIKVAGNTLTIPDYPGNKAYNTLGNFLIHPKAGLLFVDFETGDLVLLTGTAKVLWEPTPEIQTVRGAERAWQFTLERGVRLKAAAPLRWQFGEFSPRTLQTGEWSGSR